MGGFNQQVIPGTINLYNPEQGSVTLQYLSEVWAEDASFYTRYGAYVQDQISTFNDKLQLLLGVRYNHYTNGTRYDHAEDKLDDYKDEVEKPVVPRFGVVYKVQPRVSLYASYAESYEVNGYDWIDVRKQVPPTFGKQVEFGIKGDFLQQRLGVTLSAFNINKENVYNWGYSDTEPEFDYISWTPEDGAWF